MAWESQLGSSFQFLSDINQVSGLEEAMVGHLHHETGQMLTKIRAFSLPEDHWSGCTSKHQALDELSML